MKQKSGFEKFYSDKKSGGAKKEAFRKEKRELRKEREQQIEAKKNRFKPTPAGAGRDWQAEIKDIKSELRGKDTKAARPKIVKGTAAQAGRIQDKNKVSHFKEHKAARPQQSFADRRREEPVKKVEKPVKRDTTQNLKPAHGNTYKTDNASSYKPPVKRAVATRPYGTAKGAARAAGTNFSGPQQHTAKAAAPRPAKDGKQLPTVTAAAPSQLPLNKFISHGGVCSRRDAATLIRGGKVKVNGELITEPGHKVWLTDEVRVAGKKVTPVKDFVYVLLNKPKDFITTTDDPQGRRTVLDLIKHATNERIYPVGRLDRNTSGVLLLTNDGELSQKLTHPSNEIKKIYSVTLNQPLQKAHFEAILKGVPLDDGVANVDVLAYADSKDKTQVGVELHTGRNRIVRRIFEHFGYEVKTLDRVVFAGLTKKNIERGKWRHLAEKEVRQLKYFGKGK